MHQFDSETLQGTLEDVKPRRRGALRVAGDRDTWRYVKIAEPRHAAARRPSSQSHVVITSVGDLVALAVAYLVAALITSSALIPISTDPGVVLPGQLLWLSLFIVTSLVVFSWQGHYAHRSSLSAIDDIPGVVRSIAISTLAFITMIALAPFDSPASVSGLIAGALAVVTVPVLRGLTFSIERRRRREGAQRNVVILGMGEVATELAAKIAANPGAGMHVVAFADNHAPPPNSEISDHHVHEADGFSTIIDELDIDQVIVAFANAPDDELLDTLRRCDRDVELSIVPRFFDITTTAPVGTEQVSRFPFLTMQPTPCSGVLAWLKRIVDILISGLVLVAALPVLVAIAIAVKREDGGPVFFRQTRVGLDGEHFRVLKFRTMVPDAEARLAELRDANEMDSVLFKMRDDPRITRVGRFLRKYSLDELPQFWNVLRGEMATIGPRPPLPSEVEEYPFWFAKRLEVRPGITGLWQVSGRSDLDFKEATKLDLQYVEHWSVWLDMKIFLQTIRVMLGGAGGY